jgi:hypothetical protein
MNSVRKRQQLLEEEELLKLEDTVGERERERERERLNLPVKEWRN